MASWKRAVEGLVTLEPKRFQRPDPSFWAGKRVLVTGHTGFKGSWLTIWLARLGAEVTGIGLAPATTPSLFALAGVERYTVASHIADIRDAVKLRAIVRAARPEIILHLAAQSLVLPSYEYPLDTFSTNIQGTANLLDSLRGLDGLKVVAVVTTDKVYENPEDGVPFRESDPLGGYDPYSASKAAAEIVTASYRRSFLEGQGVAIATARAGNVIGGGDWSEHRLVPDAVRAWEADEPLAVRCPEAVRPWQHVLEPLAGYLCLCERLWSESRLAGAFNFGPQVRDVSAVRTVIDLARAAYGTGRVTWGNAIESRHEAACLSLDAEKARRELGFEPRWSLAAAVTRTMNWYRRNADGAAAMDLCAEDIGAFEISELEPGTS